MMEVMSLNNNEHLVRLNFFYNNIFGEDIDMDTFDHRLKLQKSIYILKSEGINFNYSFTWYIYGPYSSDLTHDGYSFVKNRDAISGLYSPQPKEQTLLTRIKKARMLFNDSDRAELIASFLYLKDNYGGKDIAEQQLKIRKPRFSSDGIRKIIEEWILLTKPVLSI
jgi:uncharacterized protein YwgA